MALQDPRVAKSKRKEQLRLWEESESSLLNEEQSSRPRKAPRVKFNKQCMFLAACSAGDKEEVERLIDTNQADINTANVDGLTALHQACIDNNIEMVEFLIDKGIDLNIGDNEGWTPLHATASCGYVSIAQLLLERGASLDIVNVDNELPVDRAEDGEMKKLLESEAKKQGIDEQVVRKREQKVMLDDIKRLLEEQRRTSRGKCSLVVDPKSGATALHVAAAKGYTDVIHLLLKENHEVHARDNDGWTPLHAAAHWEQKEACGMLVKEGLADLEQVTNSGQSVADVCDESLSGYIDELKLIRPVWVAERASMVEEQREVESPSRDDVTFSLPPPNCLKRRTSVTRMSGSDKSHLKAESAERISVILATPIEEEPSVEATIDLPQVPAKSNPQSSSASATLNLTANSSSGIKRSFVPPVRDEESETQRKAHAKRVRETRRSTQGVSLEDIKSAETYVTKNANGKVTQQSAQPTASSNTAAMDLGSDSSLERRTSWRERAAAEQRQRQIEDAPHLKIVDSIEAVQHHQGSDTGSSSVENDGQTNEDYAADKENAEVVNQQRRRRSKRRCNQSGTQTSDDLLQQLVSINDIARSKMQDLEQQRKTIVAELPDSSADYKKLYEHEQRSRETLKKDLEAIHEETSRLKELLCEKDEEVLELRKNLEVERNRRLDAEKNLKDIQNDVRNVDTLKKKIEQMQEENAALIRVISKLSISNHK